METKILERVETFQPTVKDSKKLDLFDETLNYSELKGVLFPILDAGEDFYKLKNLQSWILNHEFNSEEIDNKLKTISEQKKYIQEISRMMKKKGLKVRVVSQVELIKD